MAEHQNFTKKLIIREDYVKKDGTSTLYIYVGIDGQFERINLKITWPVTYFDKKAGKIQARRRNDKDFNDYTLIIET